MGILRELRQRARSFAGPLAVACAIGYLGYHAIQGDRGLLTWLQLSYQAEKARTTLAVSRAEEIRLARRVTLLRADGLDPDMLDERARAVLNLAHPDDVVVFIDSPAAR